MAGCWHRRRLLSRRVPSLTFGKSGANAKQDPQDREDPGEEDVFFFARALSVCVYLTEVEADRVHDACAAIPEVVDGAHDGQLAVCDTVSDQAGALRQQT
jgi:hypothetical protein